MVSPMLLLATASSGIVMLASESPGGALLSAIAQMRRSPSLQARERVLSAVRELESSEAAPAAASADGRWALIYSTQEAGGATSGGGGLAQALVDTTYAAFFKVAPLLAGKSHTPRFRPATRHTPFPATPHRRLPNVPEQEHRRRRTNAAPPTSSV